MGDQAGRHDALKVCLTRPPSRSTQIKSPDTKERLPAQISGKRALAANRPSLAIRPRLNLLRPETRTQALRIFSTMAVVELFSTSPNTFTTPP